MSAANTPAQARGGCEHLAPLLAVIDALSPAGDAARHFHGRGGRFPGCEAWALDVYPPVVLLTAYAEPRAEEVATLEAALKARWATLGAGEPTVMLQWREAGKADNRLLCGAIPDQHTVTEDGGRYAVHLVRGQNHGLFLDTAEARRWVRAWASAQPGGRVLNLFAYTGAFGVAARQGGAREVHHWDMAAGALSLAKRNHALSGVPEGVHCWPHDVFTSWGKIKRFLPYDLVIADPPSHQKGSFVAEKDYARLVRRLPDLLAPGARALLCLNSTKLSEAWLRGVVASEAPALVFERRLLNPAGFADAEPDRALKALLFRMPVELPVMASPRDDGALAT